MATKIALLYVGLFAGAMVQAISTAWRPSFPTAPTSILHRDTSIFESSPAQAPHQEISPLLVQHDLSRCTLYKIAMNQQLYFEYVHYKTDLPDMKEFSLCMWTKFYNHSTDHPLFSYAVGDQPRGILSWVANTDRSSYYMMNIDGHNLYRLNYPLRLNKWYHSCQSWSGRTGEWQIWVNDERVGRGFNNRLVGHVIKGGGIPITGQEQRQLGGGFLEGEGAPPGSGGLLGEFTMVQLYGVALTAGKAHKDHKHHHAHRYEHETGNNTPRPAQPPIGRPLLPQNPFLTGGQINRPVKLNPGSPVQIVQGGVTLRHPAVIPRDPPLTPPFSPTNLSPSAAAFALRPNQLFGNLQSTVGVPSTSSGILDISANLQDDAGPYHNLFKREKSSLLGADSDNDDEKPNVETEEISEKSSSKKRNAEAVFSEVEQEEEEEEEEEVVKDKKKNEKIAFVLLDDSEEKRLAKRDSEKRKRGLVQLGDGLVVDDAYISQGLENEYFAGLTNFGLQLPKYENKDDEREPAEAEVKMIMDVCDGCAEEPFSKALIMAWRSVPKKLYSGAVHIPAVQACKAF